MKTKITSSLVILALLIAVVSSAQPLERKRNENRKAMMMKRHQHAMQDREPFFTDEQKEQVKQIKLETAKKVKPLKNELRELMARQKTLTTANEANMKAINKNIEEMADIKTEMAKIHAAQHQEIRSLLSDEQLLKFDQFKGRNGKRMHHEMRGRNTGPQGRQNRIQG